MPLSQSEITDIFSSPSKCPFCQYPLVSVRKNRSLTSGISYNFSLINHLPVNPGVDISTQTQSDIINDYNICECKLCGRKYKRINPSVKYNEFFLNHFDDVGEPHLSHQLRYSYSTLGDIFYQIDFSSPALVCELNKKQSIFNRKNTTMLTFFFRWGSDDILIVDVDMLSNGGISPLKPISITRISDKAEDESITNINVRGLQ